MGTLALCPSYSQGYIKRRRGFIICGFMIICREYRCLKFRECRMGKGGAVPINCLNNQFVKFYKRLGPGRVARGKRKGKNVVEFEKWQQVVAKIDDFVPEIRSEGDTPQFFRFCLI